MSADERVHYFSNGTEGEHWMSDWCYRCVGDHDFHPGGQERTPCEHQCHLFVGTATPVLVAMPVTITMSSGHQLEVDNWQCIEFARCSCDLGPDDPGVPERAPIDPNQGALFDADVLMPGVYRDVVLDTFEQVPI